MVAHTRKHRRRIMRALTQGKNMPVPAETANRPVKQQYFSVTLGKAPVIIHLVDPDDPCG